MKTVSIGGLILAGISALFGVTLLLGSWYTIDQSERGVLTRNGKVIGTAQPGLGFKAPLIDGVEKVSIQNKLLRWEKLEGYSHDQQSAHYMISVNYQIIPDRVSDVYVTYGGEAGVVARILTPNVLKNSKVVIGQYTAQTSIQDRGRLNADVTKALQDATAGSPISVMAANVEDIQFGAEYLSSINARMVAEVKVQTSRQNLANEKVLAEITVTKANATADATRADAQAQADAIRFRGIAEGSAIEAKAKALGANPNLVELIRSERWNGALPTTMLPGGVLPMLNVGK